MDHTDSLKWIGNWFRFREIDHDLLIQRYAWWYSDVFLRSFPSQTMRVCSHAYWLNTYYDTSWLLSALTSHQ